MRVTQRTVRTRKISDGKGGTLEQTEVKLAVYHISVVAEMVETHPQTLRMYERMGLVAPRRTRNNIRLYSDDDIEQVRRIQHLTQDLGVNLAGVEVVFKLLREMERIRQDAEQELAKYRAETERQGVVRIPSKSNGQAAGGSHSE